MAHTVFKTSVPYNNIKLGADVGQWGKTEQTSADNTTFVSGIVGTTSMSDLQRAAGSNIDPNDGIVGSGGLKSRYGISVLADVAAGDGVYTYQVGGTSSDFVGTRSYNMSGTPSEIRLGRFASWDYTAVADGVDVDAKRMAVLTGTSTCRSNANPVQIFENVPLYIADISNGTNYNLMVRAAISGDKFSSNIVNNRVTTARSGNFAGSEVHIPLKANYTGGTTQAVLGIGRSSSSTSFYRVSLHNVTLNSGGSMTLAYSNANAGDFNFGNSNCAPHWGNYIADDTVVCYIGRGGASHKLARLTVSGTTATNTNLVTVGTTTYGAGSGQVASTHTNFGTTKYTFMIKGDTRSTFNNYVKIQAFNSTSGLTTLGSLTTLVTSTNNVKTARMSILATTADYIYFIYGYSNASGDIPLQVARFNISNNTYTQLGSTVTYTFNDTNLIQFFNIETLTAVKKTAIQKSGESFIPGQSNDFADRVYWTMVASTNIDGDPVDTVYGYFDITNNVLSITDSARTYGRQVYLASNNFLQENTGFLAGANDRSSAGLPWALRIGGRSASSAGSSTEVAVAGHALDKTLDWSNGSGTDPGSNVYDTTGALFYADLPFDGASGEPSWGELGKWRYAFGANNWTDMVFIAGRRYAAVSSWSSTTGYSINAVGPSSYKFFISALDHDDNDWDDFLTNSVKARIDNGQDVELTVTANNSNLLATFDLTASITAVNRVIYDSVPYFEIGWFPGVNYNHQGNAWAFANSYGNTTSTFIGFKFRQI